MPQYDFVCKDCKQAFSKALEQAEYEEGSTACFHCGSRKVEQQVSPLCGVTSKKSRSQQTVAILGAADERLAAQDQRTAEQLAVQKVEILSAVDKRLQQLEQRFMQRLDKLTTTLDKFLKRMTDMEEEFTFMKGGSPPSKSSPARKTWRFIRLADAANHKRERAFRPLSSFCSTPRAQLSPSTMQQLR